MRFAFKFRTLCNLNFLSSSPPHKTDIYLGEKFHEVKTMNETFDGNSTFFRKGRYIEQLQAFTKNFRRDQIMVLSSTGIFKNTQVIMENIRKFIDVKEHESFDVPLPHGKYVIRVHSVIFMPLSLIHAIILINKFLCPLFFVYCLILIVFR